MLNAEEENVYISIAVPATTDVLIEWWLTYYNLLYLYFIILILYILIIIYVQFFLFTTATRHRFRLLWSDFTFSFNLSQAEVKGTEKDSNWMSFFFLSFLDGMNCFLNFLPSNVFFPFWFLYVWVRANILTRTSVRHSDPRSDRSSTSKTS